MQHTVFHSQPDSSLGKENDGFIVQRPKMAEETLENAFNATLSPCTKSITEYDLPVRHLSNYSQFVSRLEVRILM
jgi:hypothetical protein